MAHPNIMKPNLPVEGAPTKLIGRRKALQLLGLAGIGTGFIKAAGGTVAYGAEAAVQPPPPIPNALPDADFKLLSRITEIIIPKTDTAGAVEAGVPEFIGMALFTMNGAQLAAMSGSADVFTDNPPVLFADGFQWIRGQAKAKYGSDFMDLGASEQVTLLEALFADAETGSAVGRGAQFLRSLKTLTTSAYYTSEEGLLKELGYKGNMPHMGFQMDCDPKPTRGAHGAP